MPTTTRELGYSIVKAEVLVAGKTSTINVSLRVRDGDESRIITGITGPDLIGYQGPEPAGDEHVIYILKVAPDGNNPESLITVTYADNAPATEIRQSVSLPIVASLTPTQAVTGNRRFTIYGHFLDGCTVVHNGGVGRIIRQLNHGNAIHVDIETADEGDCFLVLRYGHRQVAEINLPNILFENQAPPQANPTFNRTFGRTLRWFIPFVAIAVILSIIFFN